MSLIQLSDPVPVKTPLGEGYALFIEATANNYWWTVALDNGAVVTFGQNKIRVCRSYTHGRGLYDEEMKKIIGE